MERQIRQLTVGSPTSYSFIGDKSAKIIPEALTTEQTIPLAIPTQFLFTKKRSRKKHLNGLACEAFRDLLKSHDEESRDVQVDGVGLGFARGAEKTPIVTKVPPELARSPEISVAHVRIPHQSSGR